MCFPCLYFECYFFFLSNHDPVCYFCVIPAADKTEKRVVILSLNMLIFFLPHMAFNPIICEHPSIIHVFIFTVLCGGREYCRRADEVQGLWGLLRHHVGYLWLALEFLTARPVFNKPSSPIQNRGRGLNLKKEN